MNILNKEKILEQAKIFIDEGKFDRAIREYEKILLADPKDMRVKLKIAELYTKRKQINEAIRIYREVADAYTQDKFYLKAVTVLKNILRLNPSLIEVNEQLALLYEKMELPADATRQYDILLSALEQRGIKDRVMEILSHIVKLNPKDGAIRIRLAERYHREGKMDEAINEYEEYARQLAKSGENKTKLAEIYEKILSHRPDREEMFVHMIKILGELGDSRKLLKWLESGKVFVDKDPGLLELAARLYAEQNQNESARIKYMMLAELHCTHGEIEKALDACCEILVILPEEEDRLARRIEEIKHDALPGLVERALKLREQREQEEEKRREEKALHKEQEEKDKEREKENVKMGRPKSKPKPAAAIDPDTQSPLVSKRVVVEPLPNCADADSAYALGMVYLQAGLKEEARQEFGKAKLVYKALQEKGAADDEIKSRLEYIEEVAG